MEKLRNSRNGNPRYRMRFENGIEGRSKTDASWPYAVSDIWLNKPIIFHFHYTNSGRCIIDQAVFAAYKETSNA
jgi:hypothetical protein